MVGVCSQLPGEMAGSETQYLLENIGCRWLGEKKPGKALAEKSVSREPMETAG